MSEAKEINFKFTRKSEISGATKSKEENKDFVGVEEKWKRYWEKEGIYKWKGNNSYSSDTPPPTVSGKCI